MNFLKKMTPLMLGLIMISLPALSQVKQQQKQSTISSDDVSQQEMEHFVAAAKPIRDMQVQARTKMQKIVKDEGLQPRRFQMIMMSKRNSKMADTMQVSDKEQKAVKNVQTKMNKMNQQMRNDMQKTIKDHGLTMQRFQQIAKALRTDKDLQQRFQKQQAKMMKMNSDSNDDG